MLGIPDLFVTVRPRQRQEGIARLARSRHVEEQRLRALDRHVPTAETLDAVQAQVTGGVDTATAVETGRLSLIRLLSCA